MTYSNFIIYVDESGDHSLTSIDRDYPVFVLDFCIFRKGQVTSIGKPIHLASLWKIQKILLDAQGSPPSYHGG